MLFHFVRE